MCVAHYCIVTGFLLISEMIKILVFCALIAISAAGPNQDCYAACGDQGLCEEHCGTGKACCKSGDSTGTDPERSCTMNNGCVGYHCCVPADCWYTCQSGGKCTFCGSETGSCCRQGRTNDGGSCTGNNGCYGYHCCVA